MFFLLCCRLNVSLNELYPDKTNKNKDYNFYITFFFSLWHFIPCWQQDVIDIYQSINSRLLTRRINIILCRLNFYLLAYLSSEMWRNSENIAGAGVCGIQLKIVPRRPLHHRSDFIYHVKRDDWQEEWGDTDKTMRKSFKTKCIKAPVVSLLTSESDMHIK